ncbi:MAG: hypothetical protein MHPSP_000093 [Paramarteilia canceri]
MKRQSLDYKVVLINENIFMTLLSSKYKALLFDIRMIYSNPKKWKPLSILSSSTPHKYYVDGYFSSELENLVLTSNKSIETFSFDGSRFYQNLEFNFFTPENNLHPLLHLTEHYMYVFNRNCGEIYVFSTHDLLKHPKIVQVHSGRVYPLPLPSNNCVKNPRKKIIFLQMNVSRLDKAKMGFKFGFATGAITGVLLGGIFGLRQGNRGLALAKTMTSTVIGNGCTVGVFMAIGSSIR